MKKIERDVHVERYYPDVTAPAKEMKELAKAENPEYKLLYDAFWKRFANTFVFSADGEGLARWEDMLGIFPSDRATIPDRRLAVFLKMNSGLPYTERSFQKLLDVVYGENAVTVYTRPSEYTVRFVIRGQANELAQSLFRYARLLVPANLTMETEIPSETRGDLYIGGVVMMSFPQIVPWTR